MSSERARAEQIVCAHFPQWNPRTDGTDERSSYALARSLSEAITQALRAFAAEVWEEAARVVKTRADQFDSLAVLCDHDDFLHGWLTDQACMLTNLAEEIRARGTATRRNTATGPSPAP